MPQNPCNYACLGAIEQPLFALSDAICYGCKMVDAFRNNFHLLRLVLAALVMLSHGNYVFGLGYGSLLFHSAEWAVNGFFIISGLLISWSIERRFDWRSYAMKRFARIYPLYAVAILVQLFLLLYFSGAAIGASDIARYLAANLSALNFIQPMLGDMVDFPFNGSLWTIKIEMMFYIALPIYLWMVKRWGGGFLIASWITAFLYRYTMDDYSIQLARQLPGAMTFFIAGYVLHRYGSQLALAARQRPLWALAVVALLALADMFLPSDYGARLVNLAVLMLLIYAIAFYLPPLVMRYDISYGIYLMHFPLFVTVRHLNLMPNQPESAFMLGCALVVMLSFFATVIIEEPAIRWGKRKAKRYETNRAEL